MNYNKIFLISFSLIYSANVFSNTDSPPPMAFSPPSMETSIPLPTGNTPTEPYEGPYFSSSNPKYIKQQSAIRQFDETKIRNDRYRSTYIEDYITITLPEDNNTPVTDVIVARPFFEDMIQSLSEIDDNFKGRELSLPLDSYSTDSKRRILSYLNNAEARFSSTTSEDNNYSGDSDLAMGVLLNNIQHFKDLVQQSIDGKPDVFIIQEQNMTESLANAEEHLYKLSQPATQGELVDILGSVDSLGDRVSEAQNRISITQDNLSYVSGSISTLDSNLNKIGTDLAATREDLTRLDGTITINKNNIEEQQKEIVQVKQTANENKKHVDKYLVNNFDVDEQSNSLVGHLSSLYTGNKSSTENINSVKNDFEYFKHETNNRFYKVEKRANQGIASVAAMSNLPFNDAATFSTALGVGNYRNATAFAWGMQYRINNNVKVKASTAWNESNNWVSAGGVGISW